MNSKNVFTAKLPENVARSVSELLDLLEKELAGATAKVEELQDMIEQLESEINELKDDNEDLRDQLEEVA
jgi:uncharacterized protein Yka (UPF0111/DUF47 family)